MKQVDGSRTHWISPQRLKHLLSLDHVG
jgi:hypothetical protein